MMPDVVILARLQIRQYRRKAAYWLNLIAFDVNASTLYRVYVAAFWGFWLFAMWGYLVEQTYRISQQITAQNAAAIGAAIPMMIAVIQLLYLAWLLREPPLKFSAPDLAYIGPSPAGRGAITTVFFIRSLPIPALAAGCLATLVAMGLAWKVDDSRVGVAGLQVLIATFLLAYLSGALGWMIALSRQNQSAALPKLLFWLAIPLLIVMMILLPGIFLWPGHIWTKAISGTLALADGGLLLALVIAAVAGVYAVGNRLHMTQVMDNSQDYARIQKLGLMGQMMAPDVVARVRKQSRLGKKRRLYPRLSQTLTGYGACFGQGYLALARLSPGMLMRLVFTGMTFVSMVIAVVTVAGASSLQMWLLLFIMLIYFRPNDLTGLFRETLYQPFLRQFLPENTLRVFLYQTALPLLATGIGVTIAIIIQRQVAPGIGLALAFGILLALALCQALDMVRLRHAVFTRLRYEYAVVLFGAVIVGIGMTTRSLWAAFAAVLAVDALLMRLLRDSRPI